MEIVSAHKSIYGLARIAEEYQIPEKTDSFGLKSQNKATGLERKRFDREIGAMKVAQRS